MAVKHLIVPGFIGTGTVKYVVTRGLAGGATVTVANKIASGIGATVAGTVTTVAVVAGSNFTVMAGKFIRTSEPRSNTHASTDKVWKSVAARGTNLAIWNKGIPEQEDWSAKKKKVSTIVKITGGTSLANAGVVLNYHNGKYFSVELSHNNQEIQLRYHDGTKSTTQLRHAIKIRKGLVRYKITVSILPVVDIPEAVWLSINVTHVPAPEDKYRLGTVGAVDVTVPTFQVKNFDIVGSLRGYLGIVARYANSTFDEFTVNNANETNNPGIYSNDFSSAYSSAYDQAYVAPAATTNWKNPVTQWDVNDDGCITQADIDTLQTWIDAHGTPFSTAFSSSYDYDVEVLQYDQTLRVNKPAGNPYVDVNGDGSANLADVTALTSQFQQQGPLCENAPWQNPTNAYDVNNDGCVDQADVDIIVKWLNEGHGGILPDKKPAGSPYLDINGDGYLTSLDVLTITNYLSQFGASCNQEYSLAFDGAFK